MRRTPQRTLIAIPVYNEERYVQSVISKVRQYGTDILVVDDGSTDRTPMLLADQRVDVIRHGVNRGYGRSLRDAFAMAACRGYDWVITMDCDEQHEPAQIPEFLAAIVDTDADVISGSRYLDLDAGDVEAIRGVPPQRRAINAAVTDEINRRLRLDLTDAFCGFKAFRVTGVRKLPLTEDGYAFPMQFWVQAVAAGLCIREIPVKLIYNDPNRSFGGTLDDAEVRLAHYRRVLHGEIDRCAPYLPATATLPLGAPVVTPSHDACACRCNGKHAG